MGRDPLAVLISLVLLVLFVLSLTAAALYRNRIYETGISVWKSMVESSPDKRRPHENYGQSLSTAGRLQEALQEFKTVLSLPDDGSVPLRDVYREIGVVQFRLGLYDEAIASWKTGLVHAPLDAGLLNNISIALLKQQRFDEAISHAETATRANNMMPEPVNTLGEIYLAKGDFAGAAAFFKRYMYLRPEDARGSWNLALALARAGKYEEAHQNVNRFLSLALDPRERANAQELLNFINDGLRKKKQQ